MTEPSIADKLMKESEEDFATWFEDLLNIHHWRWTHFRPAWSTKGYRTPIKGYKGFPDYVAIRQGTCLFIELKSEQGKLSEDQKEWATELKRMSEISLGVQYFLFRPSDRDFIETRLK